MTTRDEALERYRVSSWGAGYFTVDERGDVVVTPSGPDRPGARLSAIVEDLRRRGFRSPFLLRFPQILEHRMRHLQGAFQAAIEEFGYPAGYYGVYPIKVNQKRVVVETLSAAGQEFRLGLEAGSKGELLLALTQDLHPDALIICNGFKDSDYVELALRAHRFDRRVLLITETLQEVDQILEIAEEVGVTPEIGFRLRLHSQGVGKWVESGGSRAKFGLSTQEILHAMKRLAAAGATASLRLLHFHVGSQINDIRAFKEAVSEAARLYCRLKERAPRLEFLDVGGGLAVDYEGSRTATLWSHNYELEDYCRDCVYHVGRICEEEGVAPPTIVSESGRALTAAHAAVVVSPLKLIGDENGRAPILPEEPCMQVTELQSILGSLDRGNCRELAKDAQHLHDEVIQAFNLGVVGLEDRAAAESLFLKISRATLAHLAHESADSEEYQELERRVSPVLVCNFSVFQSTPDTWSARQVFPVMPLSGLMESDLVETSLGDITCDSDGRIDRFPHEEGEARPSIPLPRFDGAHPYELGIFMVGAYQDTLGDFHNLFGVPNEVTIAVDEEGHPRIVSRSQGTSVLETAEIFGFSRQSIMERFDDQFGEDDVTDRKRLRDCFLRVLNSTTYLR